MPEETQNQTQNQAAQPAPAQDAVPENQTAEVKQEKSAEPKVAEQAGKDTPEPEQDLEPEEAKLEIAETPAESPEPVIEPAPDKPESLQEQAEQTNKADDESESLEESKKQDKPEESQTKSKQRKEDELASETEAQNRAQVKQTKTFEPVQSQTQSRPASTAVARPKQKQVIEKLPEELVPESEDASITEQEKEKFWKNFSDRLARQSVKKRQAKWNMIQLAILKIIAKKGRIQNDDVEEILQVSDRSASNYLSKMTKNRLIERHQKSSETFYLKTPTGTKLLNSN